MGCRKNVKHLTAGEKTAFVNAVLGVRAKPSVLHPGDPGFNRYDDFVETHMNAMMAQVGLPWNPGFTPGWAHYAPAFFPWHRILLYEFEKELQSVNPSVTIPYWDWADPASDPFTPDFLGGAGSGIKGKVVPADGPFAHDGPNAWVLHVVDAVGDPDYLQRYLNGADPSNGFPATLPTQAGDIDPVMAQGAYEASPWKGSPSADSCFRSHMEAELHNWIHNWVGGTMLNMTSPNDPVFWLHHCNIDRLWPEWLGQHVLAAPYLPLAGTPNVPLGHGINDTMIFFSGGPAPWADTFTPAAAVDHHALGFWYENDQPNVILETPSVAFGAVQQGVGGTSIATYRPIRLLCESCGDVALQVNGVPTAGFTAPMSAETVHPNHDPTAGLSPSEGALWIGYATTAPGPAVTGSVNVQATDVDSGLVFGPWNINLSASTIPHQASAVTLVLDRSGSMSTDAGNGHPRVELLRTAVQTFVDLMQPGDGLGIVRFDNLVDSLMPVTDVGAMPAGAGRVQAYDIITSVDPAKTLDPRGSTSIGGGIQAGKAALDAAAATYPNRAMIVLTDGLENTPPMISDVGASLNNRTYAIGFGQAAAISTSALNQITQNQGGYLIITGPITQDETFALTEYFLKIQAGVTNSSAVLDPRGELIFGVTHRIPFQLTSADHGVDIVLLSPAPYYINFRLQAPDGRIIDPGIAAAEPAIAFFSTPRVSYYRASLPMLAADREGSHKGVWNVLLGLGDRAREGDRQLIASLGRAALPYSLLVHTYSDLTFRPTLRQTDFEPGATVELRVALDQYDTPLDTPSTVWAEVARPDGSSQKVILARSSAGRYSASFIADDVGVYTTRLKARGVNLEGQSFSREQRLTAVTFIGGNQAAQPGDDGLCQLIHCMTSARVLNAEFERSLATHGFDLRGLLACLEKQCRRSEGSLGGEHSYVPGAVVAAPARMFSADELNAALRAFQQQAVNAPAQFAELVKAEPLPRREPPPVDRAAERVERRRPFAKEPLAKSKAKR
jgi:hypothetical protein